MVSTVGSRSGAVFPAGQTSSSTMVPIPVASPNETNILLTLLNVTVKSSLCSTVVSLVMGTAIFLNSPPVPAKVRVPLVAV